LSGHEAALVVDLLFFICVICSAATSCIEPGSISLILQILIVEPDTLNIVNNCVFTELKPGKTVLCQPKPEKGFACVQFVTRCVKMVPGYRWALITPDYIDYMNWLNITRSILNRHYL